MTSVAGENDPPTEVKETSEQPKTTIEEPPSASTPNGDKSPESTNDESTQNKNATPSAIDKSESRPSDAAQPSSKSHPEGEYQSDDDDVDKSESRPSDAAQPSSKKRRSNIQLNKDEHPEGEYQSDDDDDDINDEGGKRSDPFQKASAEVLKGRKIVKASKKWGGSSNDGEKGRGAFANVNLVGSVGAPAVSTGEANGDSKGNGTASSPAASAPASTSIFGSSAKVPSFGSAAASSSSGFGKSTFGSGFGAVANGFGSIKAAASFTEEDKSEKDSSPKAFGQGFGSVSTGFGAANSSSSAAVAGFGSSGADSATANADSVSTSAFAAGSTANTSPAKKFIMQPSVSITNGEEDEDCVCEVRAKLFRMAPVAPEQETEEAETKESVVPSVPSTAGRMELKKDDDKQKEGTNDGASDGKEEVKMDWHEVGIGPVRILKRKENSFASSNTTGNNGSSQEEDGSKAFARVVQRRETAPGGQGTKLILNVRLIPDLCRVHRKSEKCIQLDAPSIDGDGSGRTVGGYLFRVKTAAEADSLQTSLEKMLAP
eukprot:CCRYP_004383-RB/>CCRYP_004383-RB protein AED:0.39 eAED:0.40 QI:186/0/0/1/1/1/2/0/543